MRARSSLPCFGALDLQGSLIHLDKPVRIGWLDRDSGNTHFAWLTQLPFGTLTSNGSLIVGGALASWGSLSGYGTAHISWLARTTGCSHGIRLALNVGCP